MPADSRDMVLVPQSALRMIDFTLGEMARCGTWDAATMDRVRTIVSPIIKELLAASVSWRRYTSKIGEAGQKYLGSFEHVQTTLPGTFRWSELWDAMNQAALSASPARGEGDAPVAYGAPHQPWCQPGDQPHRAFRLRFEDPDMREMVWTGPDAEAGALAAYNRYAPAWNVYLFSGHPRAHPTPATPAVKGEVTDEWAERFCEAVNWSPDGQECKTVEGQLRCVSFRDLAKGYILAAIATDPCTPATPEGLREKVTLARPYWNGSGNKCWSFTDEEYQAILSALQPQAEGGE